MLYEGQAKQIAKRLAQHAQSEQLLTEARYFHERMQYRDFESAHLPIGSGIVESGAKQAKLRARHALVACCTHERNLRPTVATHLPPSVNAPMRPLAHDAGIMRGTEVRRDMHVIHR